MEPIDLVKYAIILSQMTFLRWLTFLLVSMTVTLTVLLFWIYLFLLTLVFVLQWLSLHWEILIILLSQFHYLSTLFDPIGYDYSLTDWHRLRDHCKYFHGKISLNLVFLLC